MAATTAFDPIVITGTARTPMGGFQGDLASVSAPELGAAAIRAAVQRSKLTANDIGEVIMGCVLPAGQGQAPARQASLGAGLPQAAGCTTVNKMCGSGLKAVMMAHDQILSGHTDIMVAGGMESMTNAPYLLPKARGGYRMGHGQVMDSMFLDGLEDAYDKGKLMGVFAELCAREYQFTRQKQDEFALESLKRAQAAIKDGSFAGEIVPITLKGKEPKDITIDEQPGKAKPEKIPTLKPAFAPDGTVTAANASSISDGAAAVTLMKRSEAEKRGIKPLAIIVGHSTHAQDPAWFTTAPVEALNILSKRTGWDFKDIDLFEINEAFAVVTMAAMQSLDLPRDKVNVHGGACALGHPIGASGARVLVTLLAALEKYGLKRGMATLCIGGGEAVALAVERL
ncbi:MAG TPA: acetyl-CoA C-acyltransferase [Patescibacteria group bacterium]|nr:acetyl-CoA C-acyltransferase [Patescibacteria group bacterium]